MKNTVFKSMFVVGAAFIFYTNVPVYLYALEYCSITPLFWIEILAGLVVLTLTLKYFNGDKACDITIFYPVIIWSFYFLEISVIWSIFSDHSDTVNKALRLRFLGVIFFFLFLLILYDDVKLLRKVRWVVFLSTMIAVANNIYDLLAPFTFVPLDREFANPGRAAGLYINANQAGGALILGMIFTVGLLPKKYRIHYIMVIFIGVLLTFSRAAWLGLFIVTLILVMQDVVSKRQFLTGFGIMALIISLSLPLLPEFILSDVGSNSSANVLNRINNPLDIQDPSGQQRKQVAALSWGMFLEHPLLGNGIGSTETWSEGISTHNMYLSFMADHGFFGIIILPLFALAVAWGARGKARQTALPFLAFVLFWGVFSHNVIQEYYFLISFALMATMSIQSQNEERESLRGNP
jgi:hypothetical protein